MAFAWNGPGNFALRIWGVGTPLVCPFDQIAAETVAFSGAVEAGDTPHQTAVIAFDTESQTETGFACKSGLYAFHSRKISADQSVGVFENSFSVTCSDRRMCRSTALHQKRILQQTFCQQHHIVSC